MTIFPKPPSFAPLSCWLKSLPFSSSLGNSTNDPTLVCTTQSAIFLTDRNLALERIALQKFAVKTLVTLYRYSVDIPGRSDTLGGHNSTDKGFGVQQRRLFRKLRHGVRLATTTTATVFGNVASEIAGSSILQPNSPEGMIKTALESPNKSRLVRSPFVISPFMCVLMTSSSPDDCSTRSPNKTLNTSCSKTSSAISLVKKMLMLHFLCSTKMKMAMLQEKKSSWHVCKCDQMHCQYKIILTHFSVNFTGNNFQLKTR